MKSALKSIVKILLIVFAILYAGVAIFVTVCLLNFNDQRITELGDISIVIVNDEFSNDYKKGDLLFLNRSKEEASKVEVGDYIFFYNPSENGVINYAEVNDITTSNNNKIFVLADNYNVYYKQSHIYTDIKNQKENKPLTAKQLSDNIWLAYYLYDEKQIHFKASEINHNLELITN